MHGIEIYDGTCSYDVHRIWVEDTAWKDVKRELAVIVNDGMSGVIPSLIADYYIRILGEIIYYSSFSLIAVLNSDYG